MYKVVTAAEARALLNERGTLEMAFPEWDEYSEEWTDTGFHMITGSQQISDRAVIFFGRQIVQTIDQRDPVWVPNN